jgi:hypothetical protein
VGTGAGHPRSRDRGRSKRGHRAGGAQGPAVRRRPRRVGRAVPPVHALVVVVADSGPRRPAVPLLVQDGLERPVHGRRDDRPGPPLAVRARRPTFALQNRHVSHVRAGVDTGSGSCHGMNGNTYISSRSPATRHLARHNPTPMMLIMPERDQPPRLPQIALHQLAPPIDRPPERPRPQIPGTDIADKVVKDRLATPIAPLASHLAPPKRLDPRINSQLLANPILERIQLRTRWLALIARRLRRHQQPRDRVPVQPRPPTDLPTRQTLHPVHPPHLRPLLHADQPPSPSRDR